ncbi:MAG: hypothetical protein IPI58_04550 [Alphaproteobacteria bacterium]|nr:MAG: hypothetical protein IPI58_04550 [Alphaproteobacteria bacterium]
MNVELSNPSYLLVCALIKDALEVKSDASHLLRRAAHELSSAAPDPLPADLILRADGLQRLRLLAMAETVS